MAPEMDFSLLGPLAVRCNGIEIPIQRGKQRQLLAALLLLCLTASVDPDKAAPAAYLSAALSRACHYHPYELAPTAPELTAGSPRPQTS